MVKSPKPMSIYIASIPFDEGDGEKTRPALVIQPGTVKTGVLKISSKYANKSSAIKKFYFPVEHWREAGLVKPSYVDLHRMYRIPTTMIIRRPPLGKLTGEDVIALTGMVQATSKSDIW